MPVVTKAKRRVNRYAPYFRAAGRVAGATMRATLRHYAQERMNKKKVIMRRLNQNITPVATGSSLSFYRRKYKARLVGSIHKKLSAPRQLSHAIGQRLECTVGRQAVADVMQLEDSMFSSMFTDLVDNSGNANQHVYVRRIHQEYLFSNACSNNCFIKIFECTARRDFNSTTNSSGAYNTIPQWRGLGAFDQGIFENLSTSSAQTLGAMPFDSKLFTTLYKVDKVINVELGPGRSHKHQSDFTVNKLVHESRSSRNKLIGGITRCILIIAYGAPVNDTVTTTSVSTGRVALNLVRKQMITVSSYAPQGGTMRHLIELPTTGTYEHMDEDGDVQNEITT